jgi:hypothetical protein
VGFGVEVGFGVVVGVGVRVGGGGVTPPAHPAGASTATSNVAASTTAASTVATHRPRPVDSAVSQVISLRSVSIQHLCATLT